jgi:hypothetical protein
VTRVQFFPRLMGGGGEEAMKKSNVPSGINV